MTRPGRSMNFTLVAANRFIAAFVLSSVLGASMAAAQDKVQPGRAEVRSLKGTVTSSTNGAPARPVKAGDVLPSGAVVKTGPASSVDLVLGPSAGALRLAENSTLNLDKLQFTETGADTAVEVQLHLPEGEMYFNVNKLSKASRYEIKIPTGVAGIRGTKGSFCSRAAGSQKPTVVLLEGTLIFIHVPSGGAMTSYEMTAPPGVCFSPTEGVKPAPPDSVQEVEREVGELSLEQSKKPKRSSNPPAPDPFDRPRLQGPEPFLSPGTGVRNRKKT